MCLKYGRQLLTLVISFDLAFAPLYARAIDTRLADKIARQQQEGESQGSSIDAILAVIDRSEAQIANAIKNDKMNIYGVTRQKVFIYDGLKGPDEPQTPVDSYVLDQNERPRPTFTKLRAYVDPETKYLALEATIGENSEGKNALLVAREILQDFGELTALAQDNGLLVLIDSRGRATPISWGLLAETAFVLPTPGVRSYYTPPDYVNLTGHHVEAEFETPGSRPLDISNPFLRRPTFLLDEDNKPILRPGNLRITVDGRAFAILDRPSMVTAVKLHAQVLLERWYERRESPEATDALAALLESSERQTKDFVETLKRVDEFKAEPTFKAVLDTIPPALTTKLHEQIEADASALERLKDRDSLRGAEHLVYYEDIVANARELGIEDPERHRAEWQDLITKRYQSPQQQHDIINEPPEKQEQRDRKYFRMVGLGAAALVGVMATPLAIDHVEPLRSWLYDTAVYNAFFDVLRVPGYRIPVIMHVVLMLAIWPLTPRVSNLARRAIVKLAAIAHDKSGPLAARLRDLGKRWGPMEPWERVVTFGLRAYATFVISPFIRFTEQLMQQRSLIPALTHGANPFEIIRADSELGRKLELKEDTTVGFNPISFAGLTRVIKGVGSGNFNDAAEVIFGGHVSPERRSRDDTKRRILGEVRERNRRIRKHTFVLAELAVAEHYGIPVESLHDMLLNGFELDQIRAVVVNPEARARIALVHDSLLRQIKSLPEAFAENGERAIDASLYRQHFAVAREMAERIVNSPRIERDLRAAWRLSRIRSFQFVQFALNWGREAHDFLMKVMPSRDVWQMTGKEFVMDHTAVVGWPALGGGRGDMANPSQLAASPNWWQAYTSANSWNDIGQNVFMHLIVAGARNALVNEVVRAVEERAYDPIAEVVSRVVYRDSSGALHRNAAPGENQSEENVYDAFLEQQSLSDAAKQYLVSLHPANSDMGGQAAKYWRKWGATFWAFVALQIGLRMGLGQQDFMPAVYGATIAASTAALLANSWWWPKQPADLNYTNFFREKQAKFFYGQALLMQADGAIEPRERTEKINKGIDILYKLYDEGAPEKIDPRFHPLLTRESLKDQAHYWRTLAYRNSPGAMVPNSSILWWSTFVASVMSTVAVVPSLVWSTTEQYHNPTSALLFAAGGVAANVLYVKALKKETWTETFPRWREKFAEVRRGFSGGCEGALATP